MQGKIIKGIAGFYYVHIAGKGVYECKAKGIFRKNKIKPLVGDDVVIDILDEEKREGNIRDILARKNALIRPAVANVDQAMVIFAISRPAPNLSLLDRFLISMERQNVPVVVCFNKSDIAEPQEAARLQEIYENCGCQVLFTSVKEQAGTEQIRELLKDKTTVVAGPSGVGKSSMINFLYPKAEMMVGEISQKIDRGKHTTRHSELFSIGDNTYLMDTPGFSSLYLTDFEKEDLKSKTLLTLSMNSGTRIPILFTDENFLKKVLNVLEEVMKAAVKSPNQVLFLTGVFPSGKRGYFAVDLTQE